MAKKSLKVKQQRDQKYKTREYNRCKICGRPHAYIRKYGICRVCFRELAHKGEIPGVKRLAGNSFRFKSASCFVKLRVKIFQCTKVQFQNFSLAFLAIY